MFACQNIGQLLAWIRKNNFNDLHVVALVLSAIGNREVIGIHQVQLYYNQYFLFEALSGSSCRRRAYLAANMGYSVADEIRTEQSPTLTSESECIVRMSSSATHGAARCRTVPHGAVPVIHSELNTRSPLHSLTHSWSHASIGCLQQSYILPPMALSPESLVRQSFGDLPDALFA
jgi:hypothetical protein